MNKRKRFLTLPILLIMMSLTVMTTAEETITSKSIRHAQPSTALPEFNVPENLAMSGLDISSPSSTVHKVLGYTTVAMGLLTGILNPEVVGEDLHQYMGYSAAVLAGATMTAGFISHYQDIGISSGFSSNNIHTILGIAGGTMMMITPFLAPSDAHQTVGELGVLTMGISILGSLVF